MEFIKFLPIAFVFITLNVSIILAEDTCETISNCTCVFPNGTGINLTDSVRPEPYTAQIYNVLSNETVDTKYEMITFFFHPCFDIRPKIDFKKSNTTCNKELSLCRHVSTMHVIDVKTPTYNLSDVYDFLGSTTASNFTSDGRMLNYYNVPSISSIMLTCAPTDGDFQVHDMTDPANIIFQFYSRHACLKQIHDVVPGRSFGSTLCIIFFSLVIFYLVLGVCTKKFLMGATGIEIIPNLGFWTDLPHLVKDGWAFAINGFKLPVRGSGPVTSPDPNSYDSI